MELGQRIRILLLGKIKYLLELHRISALLTRLARVRTLAKLTIDDTDVRIIDVPIDIVITEVSVQALAHVVGQPAEHDNVVRAIKLGALLEGEAFAAIDFVRNSVRHHGEDYT